MGMTNEEAIKELEYVKKQTGYADIALDMAIKALEQIELNPSYNGVKSELEQQPSEDWYDVPSDEMTLEQARQAVKDLRKKLTEYLEQQTSENCISRTELLSRIDAERKHLLDLKMGGAEHIIVHHARRIIEDMPSVTPKTVTDFADKCQECGKIQNELLKNKWIPVSERLPEDYIHVLCQFTLGGMGECYLAHGVFHVVGGLVMTCNEVIAWTPLPEPYMAESEDRK